MKKQIFLVLLATLASTQISHTMQQAAHSVGRSARRNIRTGVQRRVSTGPMGQACEEEYIKATDAKTIVRCTKTHDSEHSIGQCEEETWVPGLLPALLRLVKHEKSPDLFHELKEEYKAGEAGQ